MKLLGVCVCSGRLRFRQRKGQDVEEEGVHENAVAVGE